MQKQKRNIFKIIKKFKILLIFRINKEAFNTFSKYNIMLNNGYINNKNKLRNSYKQTNSTLLQQNLFNKLHKSKKTTKLAKPITNNNNLTIFNIKNTEFYLKMILHDKEACSFSRNKSTIQKNAVKIFFFFKHINIYEMSIKIRFFF